MKKTLSCLIIVLFTFYIFSEICKAEPDKTIQYLMNEPVSMFDLGLYLLEKELESTLKSEYIVTYLPKTNEISIKNPADLSELMPDIQQAKEKCKLKIKNVRTVAQPIVFFDSFGRSFLYTGKQESIDLNDLIKNLMNITKLELLTPYGVEEHYNSVFCTAPLIGSEIYFKE